MILDLELIRLSDDELRRIYKYVYARAMQPLFLQSFAAAFLSAPEDDFRVMRGTAVILVAKYSLGCFLCESSDLERRA